jgi:predicted  nucleic acid-binding Zn-ribbon protein
MTGEHAGTLKELQDLDLALESIRARIDEFESVLAEVGEPALALEKEVETLRTRLQEMKVEERRVELSADERRGRMKMLQERLKSVRNLREEAAVQAESDLLRRTLEGEEQEALTLLDQIRKMELRLDEEDAALAAAKAEVEPRREEILAEKVSVQAELARLKEEREACAARLPASAVKGYDRLRGGGRSVAIATMTPDGACGHCFSVVPLQVQNEVRDGGVLIACEACGVLLSPREVES